MMCICVACAAWTVLIVLAAGSGKVSLAVVMSLGMLGVVVGLYAEVMTGMESVHNGGRGRDVVTRPTKYIVTVGAVGGLNALMAATSRVGGATLRTRSRARRDAAASRTFEGVTLVIGVGYLLTRVF